MTNAADRLCRVWWFEGFWNEMPFYAPVTPYGDFGQKPYQNLGLIAEIVQRREVRFASETELDCLFVSHPQRGDSRDFDDLCPGMARGIVVSGAMIDLLAKFDLGETQVLELPMYEGLGTLMSESSSLKEPDLSRPVPGRWGLLHVLAKKSAVIEEKCVNVGHSPEAPWLDYTMFSVPYRDKKTVIALNAEAACTGADLWFDKQISSVPFISDRLRRAIEDAGLRVPMMKWLREAELYGTPMSEGAVL